VIERATRRGAKVDEGALAGRMGWGGPGTGGLGPGDPRNPNKTQHEVETLSVLVNQQVNG